MSDNDKLGVEVGFWGDKFMPIRFVWLGRRYEIKRISVIFQKKINNKSFLGFEVDTGLVTAELLLDKENLEWKIEDIVFQD